MSEGKAPVRDLNITTRFQLRKFLAGWEMILVYILLLINVVLMVLRPNYYFAQGTIASIIQSGMDLSFMVLGMIFVLMLGDIDISVASTMILSAMVTGLLMDAGAGAAAAILLGLLAGALCGLFNGLMIAWLKMPSVIVTIATSLLFRGIVKIILDVNTLKHFPAWFSKLAWGNLLGIPISLLSFLAFAVVFGLVLHRSRFGRELYMIGNSETVSEYSGIRVRRVRVTVFVIMGLMAAVASIFFVGRMGGGVSSTMARSYELDVIAIAVLGGVSTNGGRGRVYGPVIATVIMAFLFYTLGLLGVDANSRKIMTGAILIVAVLIPRLNRETADAFRLRIFYGGNKNIEALNLRAAQEIRELNRQIREALAGAALSPGEKEEKIRGLREKIAALRQKTRQSTLQMKAELQEESRKTRQKFAK